MEQKKKTKKRPFTELFEDMESIGKRKERSSFSPRTRFHHNQRKESPVDTLLMSETEPKRELPSRIEQEANQQRDTNQLAPEPKILHGTEVITIIQKHITNADGSNHGKADALIQSIKTHIGGPLSEYAFVPSDWKEQQDARIDAQRAENDRIRAETSRVRDEIAELEDLHKHQRRFPFFRRPDRKDTGKGNRKGAASTEHKGRTTTASAPTHSRVNQSSSGEGGNRHTARAVERDPSKTPGSGHGDAGQRPRGHGLSRWVAPTRPDGRRGAVDSTFHPHAPPPPKGAQPRQVSELEYVGSFMLDSAGEYGLGRILDAPDAAGRVRIQLVEYPRERLVENYRAGAEEVGYGEGQGEEVHGEDVETATGNDEEDHGSEVSQYGGSVTGGPTRRPTSR